MIEFTEISLIIIYIDYNVAISINRQTSFIISNIDKFNLRLIRVSQYLSKFNLIIRHKSRKINIISNVLFKLQIDDISLVEKLEILKLLYENTVDLC